VLVIEVVVASGDVAHGQAVFVSQTSCAIVTLQYTHLSRYAML